VDACPAEIIALDAANRPALDLRHAECTFCAACVDACAEPVFFHDLHPAFPHVAEIGTRCLTLSGVTCRTCEDVCPEDAIRFAMRLGGPAIPELSFTQCTGCGACIAACPGEAIAVGTRPEETRHGG
jgi:ferredoxin-type protein NapF